MLCFIDILCEGQAVVNNAGLLLAGFTKFPDLLSGGAVVGVLTKTMVLPGVIDLEHEIGHVESVLDLGS